MKGFDTEQPKRCFYMELVSKSMGTPTKTLGVHNVHELMGWIKGIHRACGIPPKKHVCNTYSQKHPTQEVRRVQ